MRTHRNQTEVLFGVVFTYRRLPLIQVALLHEMIDADASARTEIQAWLQELEDLDGRVGGR